MGGCRTSSEGPWWLVRWRRWKERDGEDMAMAMVVVMAIAVATAMAMAITRKCTKNIGNPYQIENFLPLGVIL